MPLQDLRRNYVYGSLTRKDLLSDPIQQFKLWFEELSKVELPDWFESNAMTLSTSTKEGLVSSRIVLLKHIDDNGFTFFSNYRSHKALQLDENNRAALNFFWPMFDRQVRIEGVVEKVDSQTSDTYFNARPLSSRLGAIASPQSQKIDDGDLLEKRVEELSAKYSDGNVPRPEHWGGFRLLPTMIEFWQGKPSRLHDRYQYSKNGTNWSISRLAP